MQTIYSQKDIIDLRSSLSDRTEQRAVELEGEQPTVEQVKLAYVGTVTEKMYCVVSRFPISDNASADIAPCSSCFQMESWPHTKS